MSFIELPMGRGSGRVAKDGNTEDTENTEEHRKSVENSLKFAKISKYEAIVGELADFGQPKGSRT